MVRAAKGARAIDVSRNFSARRDGSTTMSIIDPYLISQPDPMVLPQRNLSNASFVSQLGDSATQQILLYLARARLWQLGHKVDPLWHRKAAHPPLAKLLDLLNGRRGFSIGLENHECMTALAPFGVWACNDA